MTPPQKPKYTLSLDDIHTTKDEEHIHLCFNNKNIYKESDLYSETKLDL